MADNLLYFVSGAVAILALFSFIAKQVANLVLANKINEAKQFFTAVVWLTCILFAFVLVVIIAFYLNFSSLRGYSISDSVEHWGQMGDFFGGMLNPMFAFASFLALIHTIKIQSKTQQEVVTNAKNDRRISILIPQYTRYVDILSKELELADNDLHTEFPINHMETSSVGGVIGKTLLMSKVSGDSKLKSIEDIEIAIEKVVVDFTFDDDVVGKYLARVLEIKRQSSKIEPICNEIERLTDGLQVYSDGYTRIARHLIFAQILVSAKRYNNVATYPDYIINIPNPIAKEVKRIAKETFSLQLATHRV